jgi:DNA mismatch repair protein MSH5
MTRSTSSPPAKRARFESPAHSDEDSREGFDELGLPDRVLAIAFAKNMTAAALYDAPGDKLSFFEDSTVDLAATIIEQTLPNLVLISSKAHETFVETVQSQAKLSNAKVEVRPDREWQAKLGKQALLDMTIASGVYGGHHVKDADLEDVKENQIYKLRSFANTEAELLMSSFGALHAWLNRKMSALARSMDQLGFHRVHSIESIKLRDDAMLISHDALCSLQVILDNTNNDGRTTGLSLFALLNVCKTPGGKQLLRRWLMRPSISMQGPLSPLPS